MFSSVAANDSDALRWRTKRMCGGVPKRPVHRAANDLQRADQVIE